MFKYFIILCVFLPIHLVFGQISTNNTNLNTFLYGKTNNSLVFTVTAYCSCVKCCGKWAKYNKTADNHTPKQGITCAAARNIPFGTKLFIEGVGERIVQDRLAKKYDARIDIYFTNHGEALQFGKKQLKVKVVK